MRQIIAHVFCCCCFFFFHHRGIIVFVVCWVFGKLSSRQCERQHSIYGMMLKGHIFKNVKTLSLLECIQAWLAIPTSDVKASITLLRATCVS